MQSFTPPPPSFHPLLLLLTNAHYALHVCGRPVRKVLTFATEREKRLPSQWATEECMKRMHQQLASTWSLHFSTHPRSSSPPPTCVIIDSFVSFLFFPYCVLSLRRETKTSTVPFDQPVCQGGGTAAAAGEKKNFKLYSNNKITLDESMQLLPSLNN